MIWDLDMTVNDTLELYGKFPLDMLKAGERILVYCKECNKELDLDKVVEHMIVNTENPDGHIVHFTVEKE